MEDSVWLCNWICLVSGKVRVHTVQMKNLQIIKIALYRLLTALTAYLVPDWRIIIQFFSGIYILTPWILHFICESPQWLISTRNKSKIGEAKAILQEIAGINGKQDVLVDINDIYVEEVAELRENFFIVLKNPVLLKHTMIIWFNWFSLSFITYGLNLNWQALTGSVFLNFVVASILYFPAKGVGLLMNMKFGRRVPYITVLLLSGVTLFLILAFEKDQYYNNWPISFLGLTGSLGTSLGFSTIWVYTAELYPTGIR